MREIFLHPALSVPAAALSAILGALVLALSGWHILGFLFCALSLSLVIALWNLQDRAAMARHKHRRKTAKMTRTGRKTEVLRKAA